MHQVDQQRKRHSPHFQKPHLHALGHDNDNVSGITRVVLYSLEHYKIRMLLSSYMLFPVPVSVISIMIRDHHTLKSVVFKYRYILVQTHFTVNRTFFYVAVHINLHAKAPFSCCFSLCLPDNISYF